jgi:Tol biopolymer transport system component
MAPPAVSPDGHRVAIVLRRDGKLRLHVLSADGADLKSIADTVDVRGGASWSPDGNWIVVGGNDSAGAPGLFKAPSGGGEAARVVAGTAINSAKKATRSGSTWTCQHATGRLLSMRCGFV